MKQESHFIPVGAADDRLHLKRFRPDHPEASILMLHGAIENGRIFHDATGAKGLAPFLASQGFDVFVCDLRGRGLSTPKISRDSTDGMYESIAIDLPALYQAVSLLSSGLRQHWIAHSWGGVLMAGTLARFPSLEVASFCFFGSKRSVQVQNWRKWIGIDLVWNHLCVLPSRIYGYLPARKLGLGSDDESQKSHADSVTWVKAKNTWVDTRDGFDYRAAWQAIGIRRPRALFYTAPKDYYLGHPNDVCNFARECGYDQKNLHLLSRSNGHHLDYDHLSMLTHPAAVSDHFPQVLNWLRQP